MEYFSHQTSGYELISASLNDATSTLYIDTAPQYNPHSFWLRGYSSAGRALAWHARGQRFDPAYLHQFIMSGLTISRWFI